MGWLPNPSGAGWQTVAALELKARGPGLVAALFMINPEPLLEPRARIYKDGSIIMQKSIFVGIDVSKSALDYTWLPDGKPSQAANTKAGINALIAQLKKLSPEMVALEATGGYQAALVERLHQANVPVHVANPRQIRDFARSLNRLGKTDRLDALTITQFAQSRKLEP